MTKTNSDFKVIKFKGGLGNQLFQYAFLRGLEERYNIEIKADMSTYTEIYHELCVAKIQEYNVKLNISTEEEKMSICKIKHAGSQFKIGYKFKTLLEILVNRRYFYEWKRPYIKESKIIQNDYFDGCWQCEKYFCDIRTQLMEELSLKKGISEEGLQQIKELENCNSVLAGFRRGDYFKNAKMKKHYGSCDIEYYQKAIEYIERNVENPVFYVTSDDMEWVRRNIVFHSKTIYREKEKRSSDAEEIIVMSHCKHAFIANSTFLWWMAWLICNKNAIIIAPYNWYADGTKTDIIPDSWIKL